MKKILYLLVPLGLLIATISFWLWGAGNPTQTILQWAEEIDLNIEVIKCGPHQIISRDRRFLCFGHGQSAVLYFTTRLKQQEWTPRISAVIDSFAPYQKDRLCEKILAPNVDRTSLKIYKEDTRFTYSELIPGLNAPIFILDLRDDSFCLLTGFAY